MPLVSPGVEVTIIDQSQYLPAPTNSIPLIVIATAANKADASGTAVAAGTTAANANKLFQVTSQRDLVTLYGSPFFYTTVNGTPIQGYELNEYGLLAAYSALGVTNRVFVLRADIDLAQLVGQATRPFSEPDDLQYWLDTARSTWGIYEFNASTGKFTNKVPLLINDITDTDIFDVTSGPKPNFGNIGDYCVVTPLNSGVPTGIIRQYYYKTSYNQWVVLGSPEWAADIPLVQASTSNPTLIAGDQFSIATGGSASIITVPASPNNTVAGVAAAINALAIPGLVATVRDGKLNLQLSSLNADSITLGNVVGAPLTAMGITPGVFNKPAFEYGTHAQMPLWTTSQSTPRPTGSVWLKVGATGIGLNPVVSQYFRAQAGWRTKTSNQATSDWSMNAALDSSGGKSIAQGTVYSQYNYYGEWSEGPVYMFERSVFGPTIVTGSTTSIIANTNARNLYVQTSVPGSANLSVVYTVTVPAGTTSLLDFITAWTAADITYTTATLSSTGTLQLTHTEGGEILITDIEPAAPYLNTSNGLVAELGFVIGTTLRMRYGPGITQSFTNVAATGGSGSGTAAFDISAGYGRYTVDAISTAGTNYVVGDILTVPTTSLGSLGALTLRVTNNTSALYKATVTDAIASSASIAGDVMTVVSMDPASTGLFSVGQTVTGPGVAVGTQITAVLSGTGGVGTYRVSIGGQTVPVGTVIQAPSTTMTVSQVIAGTLALGDRVYVGSGFIATIAAFGTGTGGIGTYILDTINSYPTSTTMSSNWGEITAVAVQTGTPTSNYWNLLSNWTQFDYIPKDTAPVNAPVNGTNWFYSVVDEVDIMVQKGGQWIGYRNTAYDSNGAPAFTGANATDVNGPIVSATEPTVQSDGTALEFGDLWIDTSAEALENYPVIRRYQQVAGENQWISIDNTDQVSSSGILFADARWANSGDVDPVNDPLVSIKDLLTSNYLDLDAPSPSLYPQGTLLWNTRRSCYNVKEYQASRFNAKAYPDQTLPAFQNSWVTVSGNRTNGSPYMGRKAQRNMVVKAMKAAVDTNPAIRDEDNAYNLLATPNYPELQPNMIALNAERGYTGYILGDTPMRLKDDATSIQAWANNEANATSTGEDGLVSRDTYMGLFYPSGITTDLTGNEVAVPASHMMIRTFLRNDTIAYPWLAAAGTRRGLIDNATNIGYVDSVTGEFVVVKNRVGIRDVLYTNQINPLTFFTGVGLLNYGNKSSFNSQSALDRTNVGRLVAYIRRQLVLATRPFIFEPNDELTRTEVAGVVQTLMVDLVAKRGLYDYLVVCDESNNTPARVDRNELWIDIAVEPVKAVEFIYIPVRILNTGEIQNTQ